MVTTAVIPKKKRGRPKKAVKQAPIPEQTAVKIEASEELIVNKQQPPVEGKDEAPVQDTEQEIAGAIKTEVEELPEQEVASIPMDIDIDPMSSPPPNPTAAAAALRMNIISPDVTAFMPRASGPAPVPTVKVPDPNMIPGFDFVSESDPVESQSESVAQVVSNLFAKPKVKVKVEKKVIPAAKSGDEEKSDSEGIQ